VIERSSHIRQIGFVVQGLFEKSDSIGYDCVYEYKRAVNFFPADEEHDVRIFAERFDLDRHPRIPIESLDAFYKWCRANPTATVIYHYCGAWREMDDFLVSRPASSVIRWHNNTSPWFYFEKETYLVHTIEGFDKIVQLVDKPHLTFWVNSLFTQDQFVALGGQASRSAIVFPASRYLEKAATKMRPSHRRFAPDGVINMLFVGRVVHHKGHKSIVSVAARVHKATGWPVIVRFAGREDDIKSSIVQHARDMPGVETIFCGEVSEEELEELYRISDVFLCLSEHEGFGLPVFEAMRCGLPTIVWSTTALRELMADHPFGFHYYDLNMFASAVISLRDEEVYRAVLHAQDRVLGIYTADIIDAQLRSALGGSHNSQHLQISAIHHPALRGEPEIAEVMTSLMASAAANPGTKAETDRDSGYNLFSRYDVKTFRMLIDRINRLRLAALENFEFAGKFLVAGDEFRSRVGKCDGSVMLFPYGNYPRGHLIFGPYIALPSGNYTVEFDILAVVPQGGQVEFDVSGRKRGVLAKKKVDLQNLNQAMPAIRFTNNDEHDEVEFRVEFKGDFVGEVVFKGIMLSRTA
jgi:glycosyltransferase involved in cell wall biosynthesis